MNDQATGSALDFSRLVELLQTGGPVMWVIAGLSVLALTIVLAKIADYALAGIWRRRTSEQALAHWTNGRPEAARETLANARGPVASVLRTAIEGRGDPRRDDAIVREEVARCGAQWLERLRGGLRPLELIGTLAPLLGLLGTVLGMIDAFRELEAAGSRVDPSVLSGGIWVALLTTAAGLSVGIPAVAASTWLERELERLHHRMQDAATRVFTRAAADNGPSAAEQPAQANDAGVARLAEAGGAD